MTTRVASTRVAKSVAPEDLQVGDYVAFLSLTYQYPSFLWYCGLEASEDIVRLTFLPTENAGKPYKIKAICLPFIVVRSSSNKTDTIDVRQCQLAKLDARYANAAWKRTRKKR